MTKHIRHAQRHPHNVGGGGNSSASDDPPAAAAPGFFGGGGVPEDIVDCVFCSLKVSINELTNLLSRNGVGIEIVRLAGMPFDNRYPYLVLSKVFTDSEVGYYGVLWSSTVIFLTSVLNVWTLWP